jgi:hypothetical protein
MNIRKRFSFTSLACLTNHRVVLGNHRVVLGKGTGNVCHIVIVSINTTGDRCCLTNAGGSMGATHGGPVIMGGGGGGYWPA